MTQLTYNELLENYKLLIGASASLKMMMKKYHFRKGVRSGLLVRITNWASHWLFSVCSSNGVACANL